LPAHQAITVAGKQVRLLLSELAKRARELVGYDLAVVVEELVGIEIAAGDHALDMDLGVLRVREAHGLVADLDPLGRRTRDRNLEAIAPALLLSLAQGLLASLLAGLLELLFDLGLVLVLVLAELL